MDNLNLYFIKELFHPRELFRMMRLDDDEILISAKSAETMLIKQLYKAGYNVDEIAKIVNKKRRDVAARLNSSTRRRIKNLFRVCNPIRAYKLAKENGYLGVIHASRRHIYTILAVEFIKAGWSNRQIASALNISERTAARIRRRYKDGHYE